MIALAALSACSREAEVPVESRSAQDLYIAAEAELDAGRAARAGELFDEVERLYPYSDWARRAMIMSAFSYYDAQRYELARSSANRYLDFYPAEDDAAYAQYLIALSYYDQIEDVRRDQGTTIDALQALREVVERYPDSDYAKSAELKFDLALAHLAGKEMEIGRYYLKRGHYTAAINRFRVVVQEFQTTQHTPEALHRLVEAYLSLGLTDEAQTAGAILGYNYQGSVWYQDSFALLTSAGLDAEPQGDGWLSRIYRQVIQGKWL
nr:outer membrane protein assembly factor BamD [Halovulum dunhuangense]